MTTYVQRELQRLERQLEAELRENLTYRLIQKLKALMAELPGDAQDAEAKPPVETNGTPSFRLTLPEPQRHRAGMPSRKALLIGLVGGLIDNGGGSTTRQVIIREAITHRLVPDDQKKAVQIIAPILSEAKEYESDGKGNWMRRANQQVHH